MSEISVIDKGDLIVTLNIKLIQFWKGSAVDKDGSEFQAPVA